MSADSTSKPTTDHRTIERAVDQLRDKAREFARLFPATKAQLLGECISGLVREAPGWVAEGSKARSASLAEEWLAGPVVTVRLFRLLAESLDRIAADGSPSLGRATRVRDDGRSEIALFPASSLDRVSFAGFTGAALMDVDVSLEDARASGSLLSAATIRGWSVGRSGRRQRFQHSTHGRGHEDVHRWQSVSPQDEPGQ